MSLETHLGQEQQRSARPRVGVLIPQLEQFGREDGRCEETQEKEAADGQILDVLRNQTPVNGGRETKRERERSSSLRILSQTDWLTRPATSHKSDVEMIPLTHGDVSLWATRTDLVLGLAELLLHSLVQLFEGHSHDRRALVDGAHDGFDDAGQVDLQHLHAAVPHLLFGQRALEGNSPLAGERGRTR